ncbi:cytidylate kinase [Candidatus Pantoea edessiphila]|uniref:Cytidylate kinase n=1 Tax=Candidatus Pantoea edessiphila TaxID=2044610 RepID=A0A2P5T0I0_9GAMM|nr:(d)CMP kinase [Candidatus Pantoea edessiphila]PPI88085.1 cytidylate kinase [Candidatus Pantoea edessiphila]
MMVITPIITIDGPSGVGKSALCKNIGRLLKWNILNSGDIYRTLALFYSNHNIDILKSEKSLFQKLSNFDIKFFHEKNKIKVLLNSIDVTDKIREEKISKISSIIAESPIIRNFLLEKQRCFVKKPGLVADGRDMGTVVFPYAPLKIFLNSSLEERTRRRKLQLKKIGFNVKFEFLLNEMKKRDERDYNRKISPLLPASDALIINSEKISLNQVTEKILQHVQEKLFNNFIQ